jgi:transglutaminase-like putative cysteine protease
MLLVPVVFTELQGQDGGQLLWLTIGVAAALLLVLRLNLERQRVRWLRRHVTGGRSVGRAFLGGGAALVSAVTLGAVALTAVMGGAPLQAGWERLGGVLSDMGVDVGQLRQPGSTLRGRIPDSMPLATRWEPGDSVFFTVSTTSEGVYWRGLTWDRWDGGRWHISDGVKVDVSPEDDVVGLTGDDASLDGEGFREVDAIITYQDFPGGEVVAPQNPREVALDGRVVTLGAAEGPFQYLEPRDGMDRGDSYDVFAEEPDLDPASLTGLTATVLRRVADEPAPEWIGKYLQTPEQGVGRLTVATAERIRGGLRPRDRDDRYQLALAVQRHLTSARFRYDIAPERCPADTTRTDCLLESREGFCQQYATTMVMLLRQLGVPARFVTGYLPGVSIREGEYEVGGGAAHAWVEVWFDGFGWLRFDPTPGAASEGSTLGANGQEQTDLPAGAETPPPDAFPDESLDPGETLGPDETFGPDATEEPSPEPSSATGLATPEGTGSGTPGVGLIAAGVAALLAGLALGGLLWFRRLPSGGPERAWRGITGIATRFGRGPTPMQTPYEYSVTLERVVPRVAQDLRTVADAKVAATYGPGHPAAASGALRAAYARARTGLLALLFRRP